MKANQKVETKCQRRGQIERLRLTVNISKISKLENKTISLENYQQSLISYLFCSRNQAVLVQ